MQDEKYGPRWIYVALLVVLLVLVATWGVRIVESSQTASAAATAQMGRMLDDRAGFYATQTAAPE